MAHSVQHKKAISEGLKLYHKRRKRGKTFVGRLINKVTHNTHRQERLRRSKSAASGKIVKAQRITAQIKDIQDEINKYRKEITTVGKNPSAKTRVANLKGQIDHLSQQILNLKKQRAALRGK